LVTGPLGGVTIVEIAAIGPVPFAGMVLSDMGADVVRIDRLDTVAHDPPTPVERGRRSVGIDLKSSAGRDVAMDIVRSADGLIEGFRPGVMESLGLGPDEALEANPPLVYGRMTGWGQEGPLSGAAGHDLNYIALAGALGHIGREGRPPDIPLNLIGDYGGGGMLLVVGMLAGLFESARSGRGQVVDAAMVDGAALLMAAACGIMARGHWTDERGANLLDGGAPFYGVYATADDRYVTVGPIESRFYEELARRAGIPDGLADRMDRAKWPEQRRRMEQVMAGRTRDEWCELLEGTDACFAPMLSVSEAAAHPHMQARSTYVSRDGVLQPAPAPRFSRTASAIQGPAPRPGEDTTEVLTSLGYGLERVEKLIEDGVVSAAGG
jgi:alpha-methylacyl-CoA racemase